MPNSYFRIFTAMLGKTLSSAKSTIEQCVHNPILLLDTAGIKQPGSFTYCEEGFSISDGVKNYFPAEVENILTNHNCAEKIGKTMVQVYDFACKIAGYKCHFEQETAVLVPESNASFSEKTCYPIPEEITKCFSLVVDAACEKADELQAALDEATKRKFAIAVCSVVAICGLTYGLYSIYKRHKRQGEAQEQPTINERLIDSSADPETPYSDPIESSHQSLSI